MDPLVEERKKWWNEKNERMKGRMKERMKEWINERMKERMKERMNERKNHKNRQKSIMQVERVIRSGITCNGVIW